MKQLIKPLVMATVCAALVGGAVQTHAQGRRNFDPAQMRQQMMDSFKEALEVTQDDEWKVLEPKIQKIMDTRMTATSGMRGMFFPRGPRRGGNNPPPGDQQQGAPQQRPRFGPPPSAEEEDLQKAVDAKATNAEVKAALAKYQEHRKAKQAELEQAQDDLRKLLTPRQEAIATLRGLL